MRCLLALLASALFCAACAPPPPPLKVTFDGKSFVFEKAELSFGVDPKQSAEQAPVELHFQARNNGSVFDVKLYEDPGSRVSRFARGRKYTSTVPAGTPGSAVLELSSFPPTDGAKAAVTGLTVDVGACASKNLEARGTGTLAGRPLSFSIGLY